MTYRVLLNDRAEQQLESAYRWWLDNRSPEQAARWYNGFLDSLQSLRENPERCGEAHESVKFLLAVRELLYRHGNSVTHRALFTVREDVVFVFSVRHVAQHDVSPDDL